MTRAAGADDRRRLRRRARGGVRRVEVRRLGGELRGAGVDHRVAGGHAGREPGRPDALRRRRRPVPPARDRRSPARLAVASSDIASPSPGSAIRVAGRRHVRLEGDVAPHLGEEPRRDAGRLLDVALRDAAPQQGEDPPQPRVGRGEEAAQDDGRGATARPGGSIRTSAPSASTQAIGVARAARRRPGRPGPPRARPPGSRRSAARPGPRPAARRRPARGPRSALLSAAPKVRSIAITSPVAFIWLPRLRSAVGNLSNGKRGSLTTT